MLTWGFDEGPIYVVTGTTFKKFPHKRFAVYSDGHLDPNEIYERSAKMQSVVERHRSNFDNNSKGQILRPDREGSPDRVKSKVQDMRMPTGYFKVIYRPAMGGEPAHAIGFLLPHTFENLNMVADFYDDLSTVKAFWAFSSQIGLIEETSGMRFPGIPENLKSVWRDEWFADRAASRNIRSSDCGRGTPKGVVEGSTLDERLKACTDALN